MWQLQEYTDYSTVSLKLGNKGTVINFAKPLQRLKILTSCKSNILSAPVWFWKTSDPVSIMRSQEKQMRVWECGCASSYVGVHVCLCMTMKVQTKSQDQVSGTLLAEVNCERPCGPTFSINPEIELQQFIVKSHSRSLNPSANKQLSMESTGSGWADMN